MTDQELSGGAPAPDANASQVEQQTEVESAKPGSEAGSSPAAVASDKPKPDEKDGEWQRNKELTRRWREEQRRSDRLMRENAELAERLKSSRQPVQQPQQYQAPQQPTTNPNDIAEIAAEKAKELLAQRDAEDRRAQFDSRVDEFASEIEDYEQVVNDRTPVSKPMAEAIMDSDIPGEVLYYLGKNPEVARKLYELPLTKAAKEIGRIEDRLIAERKKAAEKPVSKAPPPAPQIEAKESSARVSTTSPDSDALDDEAWVKAETARLKRKANRKSD